MDSVRTALSIDERTVLSRGGWMELSIEGRIKWVPSVVGSEVLS